MGETRVKVGVSYDPLGSPPLAISPNGEVLKRADPSLSADEEDPQQDPSLTASVNEELVVEFIARFGMRPQLRLDCAGE